MSNKDFDAKAAQQWQEAVTQIEGYASAPRVEALRQGIELHKIVMQFCGWELARMEDLWWKLIQPRNYFPGCLRGKLTR